MSPRTGRPTDSPKKERIGMRLTEKEKQMLDYCCKVFNLSKTDIIRQGIQEMYKKALKK